MSCEWNRLTFLRCGVLRLVPWFVGLGCMASDGHSVLQAYEQTRSMDMSEGWLKEALRIHHLHSKAPCYHQGQSTRPGATGTDSETGGGVGWAVPPVA